MGWKTSDGDSGPMTFHDYVWDMLSPPHVYQCTCGCGQTYDHDGQGLDLDTALFIAHKFDDAPADVKAFVVAMARQLLDAQPMLTEN